MSREQAQMTLEQHILASAAPLEEAERSLESERLRNQALCDEIADMREKVQAAVVATAQAEGLEALSKKRAETAEEQFRLREFDTDIGRKLALEQLQTELDAEQKSLAQVQADLEAVRLERDAAVKSAKQLEEQMLHLQEDRNKTFAASEQTRLNLKLSIKANEEEITARIKEELHAAHEDLRTTRLELDAVRVQLQSCQKEEVPRDQAAEKADKDQHHEEEIRNLQKQVLHEEARYKASIEQCKSCNELRLREKERADSVAMELDLWQKGMDRGSHAIRQLLERETEEAQNRAQVLEQQLGQLQVQTESDAAEISRLNELMDHIKQVSRDAPQIVAALELQSQEKSSQINELNAQLETLHHELGRLKELEGLTSQVEGLKEEKQLLEEKSKELELELASWRTNTMCDLMRKELDEERSRRIENEGFAAQFERCSAELKEAQGEIKQKQEALHGAEEHMLLQTAAFEELRRELHEAREGLLKSHLHTSHLEHELTRENQKATEVKEDLKAKNMKRLDKISEMRAEIENAHEMRCCGSTAFSLQLKQLEAAVQHEEEEKNAAKELADKTCAELEELKQLRVSLEEKWNLERAQIRGEQEALKSELEHERQSNSCQSQDNEAVAGQPDLQALLQQETDRSKRLSEELEMRTGSSMDVLAQELEKLTIANAELTSRLEHASKAEAAPSEACGNGELNVQMDESKRLASRVSELERDAQTLQQTVNEKDEGLRNIQKELEDAQCKVDSLTQELGDAHQAHSELHASLVQTKALKHAADEKSESLQKEINISKSHEYLMHIREEREKSAEAAEACVHAASDLEKMQKEVEGKQEIVGQLTALQEAHTTLQQQQQALTSNFTKTKRELADAVSMAELCKSQAQSISQENRTLIEEVATYKQKQIALELSVSEAESNRKYAEATSKSLAREIEEWQDSHGTNGSITARLQAELKEEREKQAQQGILQNSLDTLQSTADTSMQAEAEMRSQCEALQTQLNESLQRILQLEQETKEAGEERSAAVKSAETSESELNSANDAIKDLKAELSTKCEANEKLESEVKEMHKENESLSRKVATNEKELFLLSQSNESDSYIAAELRKELETERTKRLEASQVPLLSEQVKELTAKYEDAKHQVETLSAESKTHSEEFGATRSRLESEVRQLNDSLATLNAEVASLSEKLENSQQESTGHKDALSAMSGPFEKLQVEVEALKAQIEVMKTVQDATQKDANAEKEVTTKLRAELDQQADVSAARIQEVGDEYREKLEEALGTVKSKEEEILSLKSQIRTQTLVEEAEEENASVREQFSVIHQDEVSQELIDTKAELEALKVKVTTMDSVHLENTKKLEIQACLTESIQNELSWVKSDRDETAKALTELKSEGAHSVLVAEVEELKRNIATVEANRTQITSELKSLVEISEAQSKNLENSRKSESQAKQKWADMLASFTAATESLDRISREHTEASERAASLTTQVQLLQEDKLLREHQLRNDLDREREHVLQCEAEVRQLEEKLAHTEHDLHELQVCSGNQMEESVQSRNEIADVTAALQQQEVQYLSQCSFNATLRWQAIVWQDERDRAIEEATNLRVEIAHLREQGITLEPELRELMGLGLDSDGNDVRDQLTEIVNQWNLQIVTLENENDSLNKQLQKLNQQLSMKVAASGADTVVEMAAAKAQQNRQDASEEKADHLPRLSDAAHEKTQPVISPEEKLSIQLQDSIGDQLAGDIGSRARSRLQQESNMSDAGRYALWKARYALEHARYCELVKEYETIQLKYEGDTYLSAQKEYENMKYGAYTQDFRDLLEMGFIGLTGRDRFGIPVVVIAAAHLPSGVVSLERLTQFIIYVLDDVVDDTYHLVYINSTGDENSSPELDSSWLKQTLDILPPKYTKNLQRLFVLHPNFSFKMFYMSNKSMLHEKTLAKITYVDNIEELFTHLGRRGTVLPGYAYDHEGQLHTSRELLVKAKRQNWNEAMQQEETLAKKKLLQRDLATLDFLSSEKLKFVRREKYADAELVKDEMAALHEEVLCHTAPLTRIPSVLTMCMHRSMLSEPSWMTHSMANKFAYVTTAVSCTYITCDS